MVIISAGKQDGLLWRILRKVVLKLSKGVKCVWDDFGRASEKVVLKLSKGVKCVWDDFGRASEATLPPLSKPRALSSQGSLGLPPGITNSIM